MTLELVVRSSDEWVRAATEAIRTTLTDRPNPLVCLATGHTPGPVYEQLASSAHVEIAAWSVVLLDEFVLPPTSAARCDAMLERDFLRYLPIQPQVFGWDTGVDDIDTECERMESLIARRGLDLAVVGVGVNGHVGFNEPGSADSSRSRVVSLAPETRQAAVESYRAEVVPTMGVTLGIETLLSADRIIVLLSGSHKASIAAAMVDGPRTPDVPASLLMAHPACSVIIDDDAASGLSPHRSR